MINTPERLEHARAINKARKRPKAEKKAPKTHNGTKEPCVGRHCRHGDMKCQDYRGCRDICMILNKRLTEMREGDEQCPKLTN